LGSGTGTSEYSKTMHTLGNFSKQCGILAEISFLEIAIDITEKRNICNKNVSTSI